MKTKKMKRLLSILMCIAMLVSLMPTSVFAAGGTEFVHFVIKEHWGVYFEQTGSNNLYPITLTNENKLSVPLPTLYRTDTDDYVFDGWYIADTDTKVTQDTVFDGYTVVVDKWTFQEKDYNTVISSIKVNNVALEAGMTTAEYNAAVQGATATVNGAPADAITADSAKTYTIYHGLNKSGEPLDVDEEVEVGQDYSVVTKIKLANGYTFDPNITFSSEEGMCASERFFGGADIYTREWNTLATEIEVTINFMNTEYYFAQTPESRYLENYAQYRNWYKVSKVDGLESVTLQYEVDGQWAIFIDNIPFEAVGSEAGGYVTVSPYVDTTKTFRLVANYTQGKVYSEPFEISWACLNPVIDSIVVGITAPQNGYSPEYTIITDTNRCILKSENESTVKNGIKWTGNVVGELAVSGSKFNNDNDYTVSIKLVAQDGYTFANNVTATINANNANVSVESDTEIRISYTFPKPEKQKWYVHFSNVGGYASGTMQPVQVEEGEYTLPEPTYTPNTGYVFEGWIVGGLLKQPGDKIDVTSDTIINAKWKDTNDYDAPHGFTKQPSDAFEIAGIQIKYYTDNFTVDPSITYNDVVAQIYNPETGEWVTEYNGAHAGNGLVEAYGQQYITFSSSNAGTFTFRLVAMQNGSKVAISEAFTVTWAAKQFTTQPQGDMVVVGETVTVTADKNFYVNKYEIEYNDGGVWKLYQEVDATGKEWDEFSFVFTSDVAKSVTFRLNAYAEGDVYDEENQCWPLVLVDTSDEFTITWTSNEHVHVYGAVPNGKDETNHWKECTDPACPDKAHSKIESETHKDNTADYKCDVCGYDMPVQPTTYTVAVSANNGAYGTVTGGNTYNENASVTVTATPTSGYQFVNWTENGTPVSTDAEYTFTATADRELVAVFEAIPPQQPTTYTVAVSANNDTYGTVTGGNTYNENATVTVTATPNSGYQFVNWTENGSPVSTDASYTFTATANRTLVAVFEAIPPQQPTTYTVAVSANNDTYGTVTGGNTYNENATVTVTATPNSGYQFVNWTENGNSVSTAASYTFTVDADRTLVAVFEAIPPQQPQTYNVTVTNGTATPSGAQVAGTSVTITANTAPSGKIFDKWVVTGVTVANANNATTTFTMPAGDVTAEATYKNAPSGGNLGGGGYYVPTVQKPTIEAGEGVKVTLSADGKVASIEALEGYELESVKLNDTEKGIVKEVKDLKTGDKLVVTAKKLPTAEETLAALMGEYKLVARSKKTDAPSGRKAIMIRWYDENDKELDFDGVEIFRSVKKNEGYGTKPIFTSKSGKYYNTSIETGTRYYYMVRGYVELDGVKYYTDWSKKAIRTAE